MKNQGQITVRKFIIGLFNATTPVVSTSQEERLKNTAVRRSVDLDNELPLSKESQDNLNSGSSHLRQANGTPSNQGCPPYSMRKVSTSSPWMRTESRTTLTIWSSGSPANLLPQRRISLDLAIKIWSWSYSSGDWLSIPSTSTGVLMSLQMPEAVINWELPVCLALHTGICRRDLIYEHQFVEHFQPEHPVSEIFGVP